MITSSFLRFSSLRAVLSLALLLLLPAAGFGAADPFPVYDCIKPNVTFWENVYSRYSLDQGIIHDSKNLALVYEVITLAGDDVSSARRTNRRRIKRVKQKYRDILTRLAAGKSPANAEEKRVREMFGENAGRRDFKSAVENIRMQRGQKDRFREGVIRSGAYLETIKKEFRDHGLPEDLAYLAHVESSYNVKAYSKFGAAGIWQFTRSTGRRFMRVNYTIDERRDPFRASHAAARYLRENYQRLGDWPMALTAYNHGANGMARAKNEMGGYPEIFRKYKSRIFGFASRNFYSEFLAARHVAKNYRRYFGDIRLDRPQRFYEFEMKGYGPLTELASHFQLDLDTIAELNPALRKPIFNGQKYVPPGYLLRLPARGDRMAALGRAIPRKLYRDKQKPSRFYEVRRGDTAGLIARRHRVSLHELVLANQLNRRATVYVGQNLRIPVKGEKIHSAKVVATVKPKAVAKPPRVLTAHNKVQVKKAPVKAPVPVTVAKVETKPPAEVAEPKVAVPVSVPAVAQLALAAVRMPAASFADASEPAGDVGQMAASPVPVNHAVVYGHLKVEKVIGKGKRLRGTIRVEVGETLGHYAEWLGVRAQDLRRLNRLRYGRSLHLDQRLRIPLGKVGKDKFEERRFEYHKEIEEDFFAAYRIEEMRKYRIKKGDNIWMLSNNEFEVPFWLIKKYNADIDFGGLRPNQQLLVPVVESIEERLTSPRRSPLPSG
ncbi:MAG: transglycosylase SLT domain-containing protein [Desulfobulbaceae bacterium]|nr:transglycosylase SLT domain-containing protein [Desulfobulbaceae bacterium]